MSMTAMARSSSSTVSLGISPAITLQKMQSAWLATPQGYIGPPPQPMPIADLPNRPERLRRLLAELPATDRLSARDGERRAAEWVRERFAELGVPVRIEEERVHGEYWLPLALLTGASALAGLAAG